jgi:hypothetical protein
MIPRSDNPGIDYDIETRDEYPTRHDELKRTQIKDRWFPFGSLFAKLLILLCDACGATLRISHHTVKLILSAGFFINFCRIGLIGAYSAIML